MFWGSAVDILLGFFERFQQLNIRSSDQFVWQTQDILGELRKLGIKAVSRSLVKTS